MHPEMGYKLCKFCENRAGDTPLWGIYIPHFGQILVKISVFGVLHLVVAPMGVKFVMDEGTLTCHPCGAKNLKSASE